MACSYIWGSQKCLRCTPEPCRQVCWPKRGGLHFFYSILFLNGEFSCFYFERSLTTWKCKTDTNQQSTNKIKRGKTNIWIFLVHMKTHKLFMKILKFHSCNSVLVDRCLDITKTFHTLINLYGGGLRLFSCASLASRFIFISLNRVSASSRAEEDKTEQSMSTSS